MLGGGRGAAAARGLLVLGSEVQVGDGLHELGLRLLQEAVDVLGTVLGQRCSLLLPVPLGSLRQPAQPLQPAPAGSSPSPTAPTTSPSLGVSQGSVAHWVSLISGTAQHLGLPTFEMPPP